MNLFARLTELPANLCVVLKRPERCVCSPKLLGSVKRHLLARRGCFTWDQNVYELRAEHRQLNLYLGLLAQHLFVSNLC